MDTPACETKSIISPTPQGSEIFLFSFATARSLEDSVPFLPLPASISIFVLWSQTVPSTRTDYSTVYWVLITTHLLKKPHLKPSGPEHLWRFLCHCGTHIKNSCVLYTVSSVLSYTAVVWKCLGQGAIQRSQLLQRQRERSVGKRPRVLPRAVQPWTVKALALPFIFMQEERGRELKKRGPGGLRTNSFLLHPGKQRVTSLSNKKK